MKKFKVLLSFIMPYKWKAFQNIFYNILSAFFSLFTLALVSPFLRVLFGRVPATGTPGEFEITLEWFEQLMNYKMGIYIERFGSAGGLIGICILVIITNFAKNLFIFIANNAMAFLRAGSARDMRSLLYRKILRLPISYFTEARKGDVLTKMSNDVQEIQISVMGSLTMMFRDPITITIFILYLFMSSYQLTLFALVLLPVSGWLIGKIGRSLKSASFIGQKNLGRLLSVVEETLSGLRIIKAFNAEDKMAGQFNQTNEKYTKVFRRVIRKRYLASPMSEFLSVTVTMVILYFGGMLALNEAGNMTPDKLIAYLVVFSQIIPPAKGITTAYFNIQKGLASLDRIDEILAADDRIIEKEDATSVNTFNEEIRYNNVSFAYTDDIVLKDINLTIKKGQTIAIVGKSGSGKSTMADLLPRFMDIDSGSITIDGVDIRDIKLRDLRELMGIVSQQAILFNDSFSNNIGFGSLNFTEEEVVRAAKVANAHDFIIETPGGYDYQVGEGGSRLSGGQRQRISIARAVQKNPPILILDEATSALDTEAERLVQDAIENLMQNRTSIVIAHRLSTIQRADLIIVLEEGAIVETGTHTELIKKEKGIYNKLYNLQGEE